MGNVGLMKLALDKYKPAVGKNILLLFAGSMWAAVGILLLRYSWSWLNAYRGGGAVLFALIGITAALLIHHFGFLRIVNRNLGRILPTEGKSAFFLLFPGKVTSSQLP